MQIRLNLIPLTSETVWMVGEPALLTTVTPLSLIPFLSSKPEITKVTPAFGPAVKVPLSVPT